MDLPNKPANRLVEATHIFQNIREPRHPEINAMCPRCGLALPHGPILSIGPNALPPCRPVYG